MKRSLLVVASNVLSSLLAVACGPADPPQTSATSATSDASTTDSPTGGASGLDASGDGTTSDSEGTQCVRVTGPRQVLDDAIEGDFVLTCDTVWVLEGMIFVREGTLTIEPGTFIVGGAGTLLVIEESARIDAQGQVDLPIVMTSIREAEGRAPARGDWGGLVLIGDAPVNLPGGTGVVDGVVTEPPLYGGSDDAHDCGTLSYLRVEWAGSEVGLAHPSIRFFACGTATTVDHVQIHMGLDDGLATFGGGFDASHVVVTGAADDGLDANEGFTGTFRHVLIHQDPVTGDNCLEWSNQGLDFAAPPLTNPTVENMTCVGSGPGGDTNKGVTLKEGKQATIRNSIFANLTNEGAVLANQATQTQAELGNISFAGSHFCGTATFSVGIDEADPDPPGWMSADFEAWLLGPGGATNGTDCMLPDLTFGAPNVQPPVVIPGDGGYAGAVDPGGENWTLEGWIDYSF